MKYILRLLILFFVYSILITCEKDDDAVIIEDEGTFIDSRDGNSYKWVKIGDQIWMAENLAYDAGDGCWAYDDNGINVGTYGRLYDWETALIVCPSGWHLPTDDEWKQLEMYIGMSQSEADDTGLRGTNEGTKLKACSGWNNNGNGTDDFGFLGLPGGFRYEYGTFDGIGDEGDWWSSSEYDTSYVWFRTLYYDSSIVYLSNTDKNLGFSVRCIRD